MSIGHRTGHRAWLSVSAVVAVAAVTPACDAILGIPGDLRDRAANGTIREGRLGTLHGGTLSAKTGEGATLWLSGASLERRASAGPEAGCAGGLCLRGSLSARGGGQ